MATLTAKIDTRKKKNISKQLIPYMYLLPAFLVMGVITFYPLLYQVIVSFTDFLVGATANYGKIFERILQQIGGNL